ncbi:MAG: hypothetical protein ACK4NV_13255 [Pannonibacter sp.]
MMAGCSLAPLARFAESAGLDLVAVPVGRALIVQPCPACGAIHRHGGPEGGWRVPHCADALARSMRLDAYRLWTSPEPMADERAAIGSFGPLADARLIARLHAADRQFAPLMRALLMTALPGGRIVKGSWRVPSYAVATPEGRVEVGHLGGWDFYPDPSGMPRCGANLLSLLPVLSGFSSGTYAARVLSAATGWRVSGLTRHAFRDFFDSLAAKEPATARPATFEQGALTRLTASGRPRSIALGPLMAALLLAVFPRGELRDSGFVYVHGKREVRLSVLAGGRWAGRFRLHGEQVAAHGHDLLSLLALVSGVEGGWWAERILTTALGLPLEGMARATLAAGLGEAIRPATVVPAAEAAE